MKQQRKIKGSYRSVTGYVTYKGEHIPYESTLERDFLLYHAFKKDVINIVAQPVQIPFIKNGRRYTYTPDYFVQLPHDENQKSLIVEVKYKDDWKKNWRDWSDKWKSAIRYCNEHGYKFAIYDESRIRHLALDNINFLKSYQYLAVDKDIIKQLLADLEIRKKTTTEILVNSLILKGLEQTQAQRIIWHLMVNHLIGFDIWNDLRNESIGIWYEYER